MCISVSPPPLPQKNYLLCNIFTIFGIWAYLCSNIFTTYDSFDRFLCKINICCCKMFTIRPIIYVDQLNIG